MVDWELSCSCGVASAPAFVSSVARSPVALNRGIVDPILAVLFLGRLEIFSRSYAINQLKDIFWHYNLGCLFILKALILSYPRFYAMEGAMGMRWLFRQGSSIDAKCP